MRLRPLVLFSVVLALAAAALAQPDPSGIEFVTIGAPGNAAWAGNGTPGDIAVGRGSVGYEYRIGKYEVTTAQWVEFFNAAYDRPQSDWLPHLSPPGHWGAAGATPNTPGGRRWSVPAGNEMRSVGNISWRMSAMYCNWLHNDKSTVREAFLNGAYDASTFGYVGDSGIFTDQLTHSPGARYWIPTWDEWLKAAHYDPAKPNPDGTTGGWWTQPNGTDTPLTYGPPPSMGGTGQANAGYYDLRTDIPLGAYSQVTSPWGAYDMAGGTAEWNEGTLFIGPFPVARLFDGSAWGSSPAGAAASDLVISTGGDFPSLSTYDLGFRIATNIPSPGGLLVAGILGSFMGRSRRGASHASHTDRRPDARRRHLSPCRAGRR